MVSLSNDESPLVFRGSPRRLKLQGVLPAGKDLVFEPGKSLLNFVIDTRRPLRKKQGRRGKEEGLRLKLDSSTPPGLYKAVVKSADKKSMPVEVHVEARTRITVTPALMALSGKSGDKVKILVMISNRGNTTVEIPTRDSLGIFDDKGIETAFASTYRQIGAEVNTLLGHFVGKLAEGHGGLLKLRIVKGHGSLQPGVNTTLEVEAQIPSKLKPGHHYHGVWRIASINYKISLAVQKK